MNREQYLQCSCGSLPALTWAMDEYRLGNVLMGFARIERLTQLTHLSMSLSWINRRHMQT